MNRFTALLLLATLAPAVRAAGQDQAGPPSRAEELMGSIGQGDAAQARRSLSELEGMGPAAAAALRDGWRQLPAPYDLQALSLLLHLGHEEALAALDSAARSPRVTHRRAASTVAGELWEVKPERVGGVLARLLSDGDAEAADGAAGALRVRAPLAAWHPLLGALTRLVMLDPSQGRIQVYVRALGAVLAAHPSRERIDDLLSRCAREDAPEAQLRWLSVVTCSQTEQSWPLLRELLAACWASGEESAVLIEHGLVSSADLRALLLEGLVKDAEAFPLFLRALADADARVRVQALRLVRALAQVEPRRGEAARAVINLLVDPDHALRREAHRWLQQTTRQNLPLSLSAWQQWSSGDQARSQLAVALDQHAAARGFASFQALLTAHGYTDRERFLADQGYESWDRFLRDQAEDK